MYHTEKYCKNCDHKKIILIKSGQAAVTFLDFFGLNSFSVKVNMIYQMLVVIDTSTIFYSTIFSVGIYYSR